MRNKARFAAVAVALLIALFLFTTEAFAITLSTDEQYMLMLLNRERKANGLGLLEVDPKLVVMARAYSKEMIDNNFFSHKSPVSGNLLDRVIKAGIPDGWLLAGENLAGAPSVEMAFTGLMNSSSHKENMLDSRYTHVGIGVMDGGPYGKIFVQEFIAYPKNNFYALSAIDGALLIAVNGKPVNSGQSAFIYQGRIFIPAEQLGEILEVNVEIDNDNEKVNIISSSRNIAFAIGDNTATVDGEEVVLDVAPMLENGKVFIPLRFVAESFGAEVKWDSEFRVVDISIGRN
ncbi:MAG: stalk domain-containing protein [Actinomycetota bacterium]|nr:stalk domain-containing protein [Actinomycetota bacterium]